MTARRAATFLAVALIGLGWAAQEPSALLTDEDVVRLFVIGTPEDEIVKLIETSQVDFDLSEEMREELKIAGLPELVVRAMIRRQAAMAPVNDETESATTPGAPRLVVQLNSGPQADSGKSLATIQTLNATDPKLAARLGLRQNDLPITDLGIALFCRTADHVPDHWRSKSPLGRDFENATRHRMLVFLSGAEVEPAGKFRNKFSKLAMAPGAKEAAFDLEVLTLEVPEQLAVELEPGVAHDLTLGIAVRVGNRNYMTKADHLDGIVIEGETTIRAILRGRSKDPLRARIEFLKETIADGS